METRHYGGIALLLVIGVLVLAWLQPWSTGGTSAEATINQTCGAAQDTDYDTVTTITTPGGTVQITASFSGDDDHHRFRIPAASGTLVAQLEDIRKDGVLYTRETEANDPNTFKAWGSHGSGFKSDHFVCFSDEQAASARSRATALPGGGQGQHITSTVQNREDNLTETHEFWLDTTGKPTRAMRTITPSGSGSGTASNITYSGFGQPNTITAPVLGGQ